MSPVPIVEDLSLSEPSPIDRLGEAVARQLTKCRDTLPILHRWNFNVTNVTERGLLAVYIWNINLPISAGLSQSVQARLHTRYSPVRRSPSSRSGLRPACPLDLHVLGLPLAFIL